MVENAEEAVCALEKVAQVSLFENIAETANQTCDAITENPGAAVAIAAAAVVVIGGFLGSWLWSRKPAKLQAEIDDEEMEMAKSLEYFSNLDEDDESEDELESDEKFGFLKYQQDERLNAMRENLERGVEELHKKIAHADQKGKEAQKALEEVRAAVPSYESKAPKHRRQRIYTRTTTSEKDTIHAVGTKVQKPVNDPYGTSAAAVSIAHSYKKAKEKANSWSVQEIMTHLGLNADGSFPKDESARLRAIAKLDKFYTPGEGDDKGTAVRELPKLN